MGKNKKYKSCYMCSQPATSKEHVPPACLFPEEKDIKTSIFRNNLITVPSCDLHNLKKSKDDEFLMACLAGIVGNNVIGFFHNLTKVKRALDRKGNLLHVLMKEPQEISIKNKQGYVLPVLVGSLDFERLYSCFKHMAYGLYYHKFGKTLNGECHVIMDFIKYNEQKAETYKLLCRKRFEMEPKKPQTEGTNPEIFRYQFFEPDEFGLIALGMTFYEGATVFVSFQPANSAKPFHLAAELIHSGIKTVVFFDDGSEFKFNHE